MTLKWQRAVKLRGGNLEFASARLREDSEMALATDLGGLCYTSARLRRARLFRCLAVRSAGARLLQKVT